MYTLLTVPDFDGFGAFLKPVAEGQNIKLFVEDAEEPGSQPSGHPQSTSATS